MYTLKKIAKYLYMIRNIGTNIVINIFAENMVSLAKSCLSAAILKKVFFCFYFFAS